MLRARSCLFFAKSLKNELKSYNLYEWLLKSSNFSTRGKHFFVNGIFIRLSNVFVELQTLYKQKENEPFESIEYIQREIERGKNVSEVCYTEIHH